MARIRERLTYANVMVTILAFVVLGGTAWAVAQNSIGTKQLKKNAVKTSDIAGGAVTAEKLAIGVIPAAPNVTVRSTTQSIPLSCSESNPIPGSYFLACSGQATITASCNGGEHATGGGYTPIGQTGPPSSLAAATESRPDPASGTPGGWFVKATGSGGNSGSSPGVQHPPDPQMAVYAICST
jgi:hypothetical protein